MSNCREEEFVIELLGRWGEMSVSDVMNSMAHDGVPHHSWGELSDQSLGALASLHEQSKISICVNDSEVFSEEEAADLFERLRWCENLGFDKMRDAGIQQVMVRLNPQ